MNDLKPLLSDEEIREAAGIFARQFGLLPGGNVAMDFSSGARFARSLYEADRAKLLDRIAELEAMVPRWVPVAQKIALDIQGWLPLDDQKCGDSERLWLMVPPIPLPEKGSE